jgi:alcohol dehydrogenase class IV
MGVSESDIPALVRVALMNTGNADNPVDVADDDFTLLFRQALA